MINSYQTRALAKFNYNMGFTLAEVLITLGIIGIVAALTIPSLVSKYQMKAFETAFKKQYSVLNNTINYLNLEEGLSNCYAYIGYSETGITRYNAAYTDCNAIKEEMISKLKLTNIKNDVNYAKRNDILTNGGYAINLTVDYDSIVSSSKAYLLPDGAVILTRYPNGTAFGNTVFIIDINGKKAPNKWGYDVFMLTLVKSNGDALRLSDEFASLAEKGGRLPRTILQNKDEIDSGDIKTKWN